MKIQHYISAIVLIILSATLTISCTDDKVSTDSRYKLSFSEDTHTFDTIFTTIGSTTAKVKVYNNNKVALNISSISLAHGANSPFKLNVSGKSSSTQFFSNTFIRAKDSMYIFVQITVNPTNQNSPFLIQDSIIFSVNGNTQYLRLEAFGQNIIILKNATIGDTTLTNAKPYLIYGNLTANNLTIDKGCTLYFHNNAGLIINGNLNAVGTLLEPITLRGDRLDDVFKDTPYDSFSGLWNGIKFTAETGVHQLEYVNLRNAITGINIGGENTLQPQLSIKNSIINNFDSCGVMAKNVKLEIINSQISNCGQYCLKIQGGEFNIIHCTIANYFANRTDKNISVLIKNYDNTNGLILYPITQGNFKNSIIYGNKDEELTLDYKINNVPVTTDFNVNVTSCLIKGASSTDSHFSNILWSSSSQLVFVNTAKYPFNFQLLQNSPARNTADIATANLYPTDIKGISRLADGQPDMGAYEWVQP